MRELVFYRKKYVNDLRSGSGRCGIRDFFKKAISIAEYQS